jgi:hypothetical protein
VAKLIEVDEEEYLSSKKLRDTVATWMKNPAARRKLLEANKAADPKAEIPELDQPDPIEAKVTPVLDELKAIRKELAEDKAKREQDEKLNALTSKIESGFRTLRSEHGLTAEGEQQIRKVMEEEGITNVAVAWNHFNAMHPPATPVTPGIGGWNFLEPEKEAADADYIDKLFKSKGENDQLALNQSRSVLSEMRGARR